jgi:hypothetical protein
MAHVDRKSFAAERALAQVAWDNGLEKLAQQIALAEAAMTVLGKRRMVGNIAIEPQNQR